MDDSLQYILNDDKQDITPLCVPYVFQIEPAEAWEGRGGGGALYPPGGGGGQD